uniref:YbaK/EbsC family protein n=1 Tax=Kineococcus sp. SYSU DK023 TaxID=3383144 RepID=UPI003D7E1EAF
AGLDATGEVVRVPAGLRTSAEVARHLGVAPAAVARSSLLRAPGGQLVLVLASGAHDLFPPVLAAVVGVPRRGGRRGGAAGGGGGGPGGGGWAPPPARGGAPPNRATDQRGAR